MKKLIFNLVLILWLPIFSLAQKTIYEPLDISKVKFSFEDFGGMYTFDAVPSEIFEKNFGFKPDSIWLDKVQKAALQFGGGCSGAFVSENGLIMTNHHCIRGVLHKIQKQVPDIHRDGYYAKALNDEITIPDLYVDQLLTITNITKLIHNAMQQGKSNMEKVTLKEKCIDSLVKSEAAKTGLTCKVVELYNGGKYSLYSYKRFTDIRLVMAPDVQIAATGWDWDNFTYPRYELDFAFLRAYENGKPVETSNHFTWSKKGASETEPVFVVGRPGNTDRLLSVQELEYYKNYRNPAILIRLNSMYQAYYEHFMANPERKAELLGQLLSVANGRKYYAGLQIALTDAYIMAKKTDFQQNLILKVKGDKILQSKYGLLWKNIEKNIEALKNVEPELYYYDLNGYYANDYYITAIRLVEYANQLKLPENERGTLYQKNNIAKTKAGIFVKTTDEALQQRLIMADAQFHAKVTNGGFAHNLLYNKKLNTEAFTYFKSATNLDDENYVNQLITQEPDIILNTKDPLLQFAVTVSNARKANGEKRKQLNAALEILNQELGYVIYQAYGEQIAPDATSTLRIAPGFIKGYEYNGTIAPAKSLYYGLYDRYYAFGENDYPWGLHNLWKKPPQNLDLSIPMCFASTNDIVGGNSGSSIINKNLEVIGLVHDGNLESLAGAYIFLPENNRSVATDSWGLMEALKWVYKTERLINELENSKIK